VHSRGHSRTPVVASDGISCALSVGLILIIPIHLGMIPKPIKHRCNQIRLRPGLTGGRGRSALSSLATHRVVFSTFARQSQSIRPTSAFAVSLIPTKERSL
jgi:hypothetical protein